MAACPHCGAIYAKVEEAIARSETGKQPPLRPYSRPAETAPPPRTAVNAQAPPPADPIPKVRHCDACDGLVAREIRTCPHCGHVLPAAPGASPSLLTWLVALVVCGLFVRACTTDDGSSGSGDREYTSGSAVAACHDFIDKRLKAPATADYQWVPEVTGSGAGPWTVRGYVDSENSFGAKLRMNFDCTVHFVGDREYLDRLSIH